MVAQALTYDDTPSWLDPIPQNIPALLREKRQNWGCWRAKNDQGRIKKEPINQKTGRLARTDDETTWGTFDQAVERLGRDASLCGLGFLMKPEDGIVAIDIDHCIDDETGGITPEALEIVTRMNSYTELSPSGAGLRIFVLGTMPEAGRKARDKEFYQGGQYVTVTGWHRHGTPRTVNPAPASLEWLYSTYFARPSEERPQAATGGTSLLSDTAVIERLCADKKFGPLWHGDASAYADKSPDGIDHSRADMALCGQLARWTNKDAVQMDRLMRQWALFPSDKWDEDHYSDGRTYGEATIATAIRGCQHPYQGRQSFHIVRPSPTVDAEPSPLADAEEIARLRAENTAQKAIIASQAITCRRYNDVMTLIHDGRLKDRDVRGAVATWNLTQSFPSDTDRDTRKPTLLRMPDLGAVFGVRSSSQPSAGTRTLGGLVENGLVEVVKRRDDHGHEELYVKAGRLPDKALTKDDLRTTLRQKDVARHAEHRCKSCHSTNLTAMFICKDCGETSTAQEAVSAAVDFDIALAKSEEEPIAESATLNTEEHRWGSMVPQHPHLCSSPSPLDIPDGEVTGSSLADSSGPAPVDDRRHWRAMAARVEETKTHGTEPEPGLCSEEIDEPPDVQLSVVPPGKEMAAPAPAADVRSPIGEPLTDDELQRLNALRYAIRYSLATLVKDAAGTWRVDRDAVPAYLHHMLPDVEWLLKAYPDVIRRGMARMSFPDHSRVTPADWRYARYAA